MAENRRSSQQYPYISNKRVKQACENCRRKKSKCTGERPDCSCCVRLRQKCVYASQYRSRERSMESHDVTRDVPEPIGTNDSVRLSAIEDTLKQLAAAIELQRRTTSAEPSTHRGQSDGLQPTQSISLPTSPQPSYECIQNARLPATVISEGIALYFSKFCNQPCPILAYSPSLDSRIDDSIPPMILYPMLALSLRSSRHSFFRNEPERTECIVKLTQLSWDLLTKAYCDFAIDDIYFQGLCLHAQVDSGDGKLERARSQVALALRIAQTRDMLSSKSLDGLGLADQARRQEIIWSLFMLDRMLLGGNTKNPSTPTAAFELPVIQSGPFHPDIPPQPLEPDISLRSVDSGVPLPPQNVACLQIQTIRIWECIIDYIAQAPSDDDVSLWRHDSPRAAILTKLLDIEMKCETAGHTLLCVGSPARVLEEPELISYFLVWLWFQLTLSVINCCLNHPFIIHIKSSRLKHRIPLTFLQKSYEFSLIHANWVFRLLNHMDDAGLMIHDPFLGHLVAIAASIHLEHTTSQYPTVAASAKQKFDKCLDFVKRLSQEWPRMQVTTVLLEKLKSRIRHRPNLNYVEEEYDGAAPPDGRNQVHLEEEDLQLMWRLFDYASHNSYAGDTCDEDSDSAMNSVPPDFGGPSSFMDCQISGVPTQTPSASIPVQGTSSRLESIAVRSYGDVSLSGGSALDYLPVDFELGELPVAK